MLSTDFNRQVLRRHFRALRNALSNEQQRLASEGLQRQVISLESYQRAQTIACYLPQDGEVSLTPLIRDAWLQGKTVCLPVLHPIVKGHLLFLRYHPASKMTANRFAIPEPTLQLAEIVPIADIEVLFTPLVAFDAAAQRLGMGGGFYDRTLAPVRDEKRPDYVFGVAHDCQQVETGLANQKWDIPMQKIITPSHIYSHT